MSADKVFHSRSQGIPSEGVKDQYADGKAARVWKKYIGDANERTQKYKDFLTGLLKKHGCKKVLDTACGTGIDSMMLVDEGFQVVSVDASDKMLKHALKARWDKRKDRRYDEWVDHPQHKILRIGQYDITTRIYNADRVKQIVIEEASWETLPQDVDSFLPGETFDAVICLGNSFSHLLDEYEDQRTQRMCLRNFAKCLKPGGLLFIDHRNYDSIINSGATPAHSIYYNSKYPVDIKTSVLVVRGKPELVAMDYCIKSTIDDEKSEFRLCYYPHKLDQFTSMLDEAFNNNAKHSIYADFKPFEEVEIPAYYIHVMQKLD